MVISRKKSAPKISISIEGKPIQQGGQNGVPWIHGNGRWKM